MINKDEDPREMTEPRVVRELLSRWLDPGDYDLWRASAYRFHALVLRQWRAGRLFFLGDAAHMTPPFLAQGMCQGIRDASNLVWKLAAHRHGGAGDGLLDTYQREREPHVLQVTATAKEFGRIICERDETAAASRDAALLDELAARPGGTVRQSLIPGLRAGFLSPDGSPARGGILPQPRVTDSRGASGLLDEFTGDAFRLVLAEDADVRAAESALRAHEAEGGFPIRLVPLRRLDGPVPPGTYQEEVPLLATWLRSHGCDAVLARPDHYVFGGAPRAAEIGTLLAAARRQWSSSPSPSPIAE